MKFGLLALLASSPSLKRAAVSQKQCFFPNHEVAEGNYPCDPDADVSVCCGAGGPGSVCLNNKVCLNNGVETIRGACTDKSWNSPDCPNWCQQADTGGTDLISCQNVTKSDIDYCCDHSANCCNSGVGRFQILPSNVQTSATWVSAETAYRTVPLSSSSSSAAGAITSSSSTSTTSTAGTTSSSTTSSAATGTLSGDGGGGGLSTGAEAGIGVGAAVGGLLVIAAFTALYLYHRKRKRSEAQPEVGNHPGDGYGADYYGGQKGPQDVRAHYGGELDGTSRPGELDGQGRSELVGDGNPVGKPQAARNSAYEMGSP